MELNVNPTPLDYERADYILIALENVADPEERRKILAGCLAIIRDHGVDKKPTLLVDTETSQ